MKKGHTLIELLIVITVASILVAGMGTFINKGIEIWAFFKNQNVAQNRARLAMNKVLTVVRKMKSPASMQYMDTQRVEFYIQENGVDNLVGLYNWPGRGFRYYDANAYTQTPPYSADYMAQNRITAASNPSLNCLSFELVPTVSNLEFRYYRMDASGTPVQAVNLLDFKTSNGKWIKINLTVQEGTKTFTLATVVALRN